MLVPRVALLVLAACAMGERRAAGLGYLCAPLTCIALGPPSQRLFRLGRYPAAVPRRPLHLEDHLAGQLFTRASTRPHPPRHPRRLRWAV